MILAGACAGGGASSGGGGGAASVPALRGETLAQGESPRNSDQTRAAADHLQRAVESEAEGDAAAAEQHYRAAVASAEEAIAMDPTNPLAWQQAGIARLGVDDFAGADEAWDEAERLRPVYQLEIDPRRMQAWFDLYNEAVPVLNSGDTQGALELFEGAHRLYDDRPEVMVILGQLYDQSGRTDDAVGMYEMADSIIDSEQFEVVDSATQVNWRDQQESIPVMISQAYLTAQRFEEAAAILEELRADDPGNTTHVRNLAVAYTNLGRTDDAAGLWQDLLSMDLDPEEAYQAGIGLYTSEDYLNAADAFHSVVEEWPMYRDAAEMWARSLAIYQREAEAAGTAPDAMRLQEMVDAGEKWLELDPGSMLAHQLLAGITNSQGNEDRAREVLNTASAMTYSVTDLQMQNLGSAYVVRGEVLNVAADAGTTVTIEVTFYGANGSSVGSESATVTLPGPEASQVFSVQYQGTGVTGYTYTTR
jgi:tetratricopeptide (TPR) repeat protein